MTETMYRHYSSFGDFITLEDGANGGLPDECGIRPWKVVVELSKGIKFYDVELESGKRRVFSYGGKEHHEQSLILGAKDIIYSRNLKMGDWPNEPTGNIFIVGKIIEEVRD